MCIILVIPQGQALPSDDIFRTCWENNPNGLGIAYVDGIVRIEKYMKYKSSLDAIKSIHEEFNSSSPIVIHFRVSTCGKTDLTNVHPFWVAKNELCLFHNGQIIDAKYCKNGLSDSHTFAHMLRDNYEFGFHKNPAMQELLRDFCGSSNILVFLDRNKDVIFINEAFGDWIDGIWYSNSSWKPISKVVDFPKRSRYRHTTVSKCEFCGVYTEDLHTVFAVDGTGRIPLTYCGECIVDAYTRIEKGGDIVEGFRYWYCGQYLNEYTLDALSKKLFG